MITVNPVDVYLFLYTMFNMHLLMIYFFFWNVCLLTIYWYAPGSEVGRWEGDRLEILPQVCGNKNITITKSPLFPTPSRMGGGGACN